MRRSLGMLSAAVSIALLSVVVARAADNPRPLLGVWAGKATGPQGGPPTGDVTVTFERAAAKEVKGTISVKGQGGAAYSGTVVSGVLDKGKVTATAVFKLGENPLEVALSATLKGNSIDGTFTVSAKGQKMGDGTITITRQPSRPAK